jgi:2-dehydropantoate 2-reductase
MMEEAVLAASADAVILEREGIEEMYRLICQLDAIKTSMLVDFEKGRPLELDEISGVVVRHCNALGKEASTTELVAALLLNRMGPGNRQAPG